MQMRIETSRLVLSRPCLVDFDDCRRYWSHPAIPWANGSVPDRESCWARLLRNDGHWNMLGFGLWMIREKGASKMIGEIGFCAALRETIPPFPEGPEFGVALGQSVRGNGYAFEAATAALLWADSIWPECDTFCMSASTNNPALKLVEKLGYLQEISGTYGDEPVLFLRRKSQENKCF